MGTSAELAAFQNQLTSLYEPIVAELIQAEQVLCDELASRIEFVNQLSAQVQRYRGKRLRPALVLLCGKAAGGLTPAHPTLAAVVEMIHAATLVHDDILDDADLRRHHATVHAQWGTQAGVLLGDFLFTHAFHLAASLDSVLACRVIGRATNAVCEGELHQISQRGVFELTEEEYLDMIRGKTAELIACACWLGATFANAQSSVVQALDSFGRELGLAFQMTDDLLDLISDESDTGKQAGNDLQQQKATLPLIRFREVANARQLQSCRDAFKHKAADRRESVLALLQETDALDYTQSRALALVHSARRRLDHLADSAAKDSLIALANMVVDRMA